MLWCHLLNRGLIDWLSLLSLVGLLRLESSLLDLLHRDHLLLLLSRVALLLLLRVWSSVIPWPVTSLSRVPRTPVWVIVRIVGPASRSIIVIVPPFSVVVIISLGSVVNISVVGNITISIAQLSRDKVSGQANGSIVSGRANSLTDCRVKALARLALLSGGDFSRIERAA